MDEQTELRAYRALSTCASDLTNRELRLLLQVIHELADCPPVQRFLFYADRRRRSRHRAPGELARWCQTTPAALDRTMQDLCRAGVLRFEQNQVRLDLGLLEDWCLLGRPTPDQECTNRSALRRIRCRTPFPGPERQPDDRPPDARESASEERAIEL